MKTGGEDVFTSSSELSSSILSAEATAGSDWPSASLARFFAIVIVVSLKGNVMCRLNRWEDLSEESLDESRMY